jgi:hypothetical protein
MKRAIETTLFVYSSRGIEYLIRVNFDGKSLVELKNRPFKDVYTTHYMPYDGGDYKEYDGSYLTFKDAVLGNITILKK